MLINRVPGNIYTQKHFSVCIPLIKIKNEYYILFEVRSDTIKQAKEVCFPGGKAENNETLEEACIRECKEELIIRDDNITMIEPLDYFHNINNATIYPYLGILNNYNDTFNKEEVSEIFKVPVSYFINQEVDIYYQNIQLKADEHFPFDKIERYAPYKFPEGKVDFIFYEYDNYLIWGLTARILYHNLKYIEEYIKKESD